MDQWLVRTANNILAGPYSRDQVVRLINEGKLSLQDEVCQANQYWIFLHEHLEVERQLGIHMPRATQNDDEEITETQTDAVDEPGGTPSGVDIAPLPEAPLDYDGGTAVFSHGSIREAQSGKGASSPQAAPASSSGSMGSTMSSSTPAPAGNRPSHSTAQSTSHLAQTPTALRSSASHSAPAGHSGARTSPFTPAASVSSASDVQIERTSIWKSLAWLLVTIACILVFAVLRLLHTPHAMK